MTQSEELLKERQQLEREEAFLFDEQQKMTQFIGDYEDVLSEIQYFQNELNNNLSGSQHGEVIASLYGEGLYNSKYALTELTQEDILIHKHREYEERIENVHCNYQRALQIEEDNGTEKGQSSW